MRVKTLTIPTMGLMALLTLTAAARDINDARSLQAEVVSPDGVTREEMTGALVTALGLGEFTPPDCVAGHEVFDDVPASSLFCPWIEELARRGISGGCGGDNYCPGNPVSRAQMAAFLVKTQFPSVVPAGVALTGRWGLDVDSDVAGKWGTSISYPVAMPSTLSLQYREPGSTPTSECPGSLLVPLAAAGFLCVYQGVAIQLDFEFFLGTTRFGTDIIFEAEGLGNHYVHGTWAATAPLD